MARQVSRALAAVLRREHAGGWVDLWRIYEDLHHPPPPQQMVRVLQTSETAGASPGTRSGLAPAGCYRHACALNQRLSVSRRLTCQQTPLMTISTCISVARPRTCLALTPLMTISLCISVVEALTCLTPLMTISLCDSAASCNACKWRLAPLSPWCSSSAGRGSRHSNSSGNMWGQFVLFHDGNS